MATRSSAISEPATQIWRPLGQVLSAPLPVAWAASHASYPTAVPLGGDRVRVYFSPRDSAGRSCLGSVELSIRGSRWEIVGQARGPLLQAGRRGSFDADGVTVGCVVPEPGRWLAYYLGWTLGARVPFTNFVGLAVSHDEGCSFVRHSVVPVVGRSEANPYSLGYPWVLREGSHWTMWFGTHLEWGEEGLEMQHVVKSATSRDGLAWHPSSSVDVGLAGSADPLEFAISRPCVVPWGQGRLMWYAKRNPGYRLGFAHAGPDGVWRRRDDCVTFAGEPQSWEAHERTYPCVFRVEGDWYMLYNGDGYGRTGFGLARLENPEALPVIPA